MLSRDEHQKSLHRHPQLPGSRRGLTGGVKINIYGKSSRLTILIEVAIRRETKSFPNSELLLKLPAELRKIYSKALN